MRCFCLLAIVGLVNCASNPGSYRSTEDVAKRLKELTEVELSARLGAPTESVTLSDGSTTWTYRDKAKGLTGGDCTVSVNIKDNRVVAAFVNKTDLSPLSFPLGSCRNILGNLD